MAVKKGERIGGRQKGTPNKATMERLLRAERATRDAKAAGRKIAKDVLDDFMTLFAGAAAYYQPKAGNEGVADETKFLSYATLAIDCAKALAPFQSPTFRSITLQPADPEATTEPLAPQLKRAKTPAEISRVYAQLMFGDASKLPAIVARGNKKQNAS